MIKVKNVESKKSPAKRNITISAVKIDNGRIVDEDGDIVNRLLESLPSDDMEFTIRISIEIEDGDANEDEGDF